MASATTARKLSLVDDPDEALLRFLFGKGRWPLDDPRIVPPGEIANLYERLGLRNYAAATETRYAADRQALVWHPSLHPCHAAEAREQQEAIDDAAFILLGNGKEDYDVALRRSLLAADRPADWQRSPKNARFASRAARDYRPLDSFDGLLSAESRSRMDRLDGLVDTCRVIPVIHCGVSAIHPPRCDACREGLPGIYADVRHGSGVASLPALYAHALFAHGSRAMTLLCLNEYFPKGVPSGEASAVVLDTVLSQLRLLHGG